MGNNYVTKLNTDDITYDIYDKRIDPTISSEQENKQLVINSEGLIVADDLAIKDVVFGNTSVVSEEKIATIPTAKAIWDSAENQTLDGSRLTGTATINIEGNAKTATEAESAKSADKVINTLSFGTKNYDGSVSQTITAEDLGLSKALKLCGIVESEADLEKIENPSIGDMYICSADNSEYAYLNNKWEKLGPLVDYSIFATKVSTGKENNIVTLDSEGNIKDSTHNLSQFIQDPQNKEKDYYLSWNGGQWVATKLPPTLKLDKIYVDTLPTKLKYLPEESFDTAGMVIKADYYNGDDPSKLITGLIVTGYSVSPSGALPEHTNKVTVIFMENGIEKSCDVEITVEREAIPIPTVTSNLVYNTESQEPTFLNYPTDKIKEPVGVLKATDAGHYEVIFEPTVQYKWEGSEYDISPKTITWSIAKADSIVDLDKYTIQLGQQYEGNEEYGHYHAEEKLSDAFNLTTILGDGEITCTLQPANICTAIVSESTINISTTRQEVDDKFIVEATIKIAETKNYNSAQVTASIVIQFVPSLNNSSWEFISKIASANAGSLFWQTGDTKLFNITGSVGNFLKLDNEQLGACIIGMGHDINNNTQSKNTITFQLFKKALNEGQKAYCLVDTMYSDTTTYTDPYPKFAMNFTTTSNEGGWKNTDMRYSILGSTNIKNSDPDNYDIINNPVANSLMSVLPIELRQQIVPTVKYTDNIGYKTNEQSLSDISATIDYLPLLGEFEIFIEANNANMYEKGEGRQEQYKYYNLKNSIVKYKHNDVETVGAYFLRSPSMTSTETFCGVGIDIAGKPSTLQYNRSGGLAPIFVVGGNNQ